MPLYSYIPYLDPDIHEEERKSFSGNNMDAVDQDIDVGQVEKENSEKLKESVNTPVESFKRRVNNNLKMLNLKMSDLIQDGLNGVDNICKQVQGCLKDDEKRKVRMEKSGRGDIFDYQEEKKYNSPATEPSQDAICNSSSYAGEKLREIPFVQAHVFNVQQMKESVVEKVEMQPPLPKMTKPRSRPTSKCLKTKTITSKSSQHKSASFSTTPKSSDSRRSCEKAKILKGKVKCKTAETELRPSNEIIEQDVKDRIESKNHSEDKVGEKILVDGTCAKKRLGQIEKDYQKVVENLGMVERMMACINERMSNQKNNRELSSQGTVKNEEKHENPPKSNETKKKRVNSKEKKEITKMEGKIKQGESVIVQLQSVDEMKEIKRVEEDNEKKIAEEITKQMEVLKEPEHAAPNRTNCPEIKESPRKMVGINESHKKADEVTALNPLSSTKINDSWSDLDALIDNAVQELGNLVSTDFDISQNSSDVSFKLTNEDDARTFYEECVLVNSSSNISESDDNELCGEDSEKFEISKSFQELKDSYVRQLKQETEAMAKRKKARCEQPKTKEKPEESPDVQDKTSCDKSHDEICNYSSWNQLDPESLECKFLNEIGKNSNSSTALCWNTKKALYDREDVKEDNSKELQTIQPRSTEIGEKVDKILDKKMEEGFAKDDGYFPSEEPNYAVMEAVLHTRLSETKRMEDTITISLPPDERKVRCNKGLPIIKNIDTEQLDDETLQITLTIADNKEDKQENSELSEDKSNDRKGDLKERTISESELCDCNEHFEANRRQERTLRKQQKKKIKDKKAGKSQLKNTQKQEKTNSKTPTDIPREFGPMSNQAEDDDYDDSPIISVYRKESAEDTARTKSNLTKPKLKKKLKRTTQYLEGGNSHKDIRDIKKVDTYFSLSSTFASSSSSIGETLFWSEPSELRKETQIRPIDPMEQISIQCKKMIEDLVLEENTFCLRKLMEGNFNSSLIQTLVGRPKRPRSVRIHTPIQDPDLGTIVPEVHRKKAIADLHDRMEFQIRQTDSFDGFLTLMNKNRRRALIKQAERQDHNFRCHMKTCFRKRYPFRVVTASVPSPYDTKSKDKKDCEKKYLNSLWFSPKDFKLRRNSRIFNRKRMEMYCQSLHKGPMIPKCKCKDLMSRESKRSEKTSNYSILVRSGTPLGRRPNTPRRWIQVRPPSCDRGTLRSKLHHCDILDDLTIKDLAPFNAEYPRHDERQSPESLHGSLLYKLACGGHKGDAEETLMELIAPELSCAQVGCKICKPKSKLERKSAKKHKTPKKSGDEAPSPPSKTNDIQTLSPKAAAQLLIQNIGEIKSRKSSTKAQGSEKSLLRQKETKVKRSIKSLKKNSRKIISQDSKIAMEESLVRKIFYNQHIPVINFVQRSISTSPETSFKPFGSLKTADSFPKTLKVPELHRKAPGKKSATNKLFPYINDPNNKVFQNITVLPVKVLYDLGPPKDCAEKINNLEKPIGCEQPSRNSCPVNVACLSETDELEVSTFEQKRPLTADDRTNNKKKPSKRRHGTPKSPPQFSQEDCSKFSTNPTKVGASLFQEIKKTRPIEVNLTYNNKNVPSSKPQAHAVSKPSPRRSRFRRSSSLGKSTESEYGGDYRNSIPPQPIKRPGNQRQRNPIPWIPASRRPRTPPLSKTPIRIRSKEFKSNARQIQLPRTPPAYKVSSKQGTNIQSSSNSAKLAYKLCEKCFCNSLRQTLTPQIIAETSTTEVSPNQEKKLRIESKDAKKTNNIDNMSLKPQSPRGSRYHPLTPAHRVMVDHLHSLKHRNVKLEGNIEKAINIIEDKMVDVLSTNDTDYKKKTIDRMEKEINKVLRMINEQSYKTRRKVSLLNTECYYETDSREREDMKDRKISGIHQMADIWGSTQFVPPNTDMSAKQIQMEEIPLTNMKAFVTPCVPVRMPRPPRKRSISRVLKCHNRPCTVEEEVRSNTSDENFEVFEINEGEMNKEHGKNKLGNLEETHYDKETGDEVETEKRSMELYSTNTLEPFCPTLRCPSPKPSLTCQNLRHNAKKAPKKMSREAFGKFADVVRTKTSLIINMTERFDIDEANILPGPQIISTLPTIMAPSAHPAISKMHHMLPNTTELMSTTVSSIVSVQKAPVGRFLSAPTTEISEFGKYAERSITSFSDSDCSYTWSKFERACPMDFKTSSCSVRCGIPNTDYLTPFMKAIHNLKSTGLVRNRRQLIPVEEISPSFTKLMDFLEGLSNVKRRLNQRALKDVQLMWNPEKRCSYHSSIKSAKRITFGKMEKTISEHSIIPSLTSCSLETECQKRIQERITKINIKNDEENLEKKSYGDQHQDNAVESGEYETKIEDIYKSSESNLDKVEYVPEVKRSVELSLSEIHLVSIPNTENLTKMKHKNKGKKSIQIHLRKDIHLMNEYRYATFLKFFYLIFYGLMYFCMSVMNFAC